MGQDVRENITNEPTDQRDAAPARRTVRHGDDGEVPEPHCSPERLEIARAQQDPFAFAPLYERYVDAIFGYCYRRTSDREQAADLTSQVFVKALGALSRFDPKPGGSTFRSWLFSIAHNHIVDAYRLHRDASSLDDHHHMLSDASPSPEEQAIASEQRRELARAMAALTDGQRQIVELRLAGLTGPEIASVLNMGLAAVKSSQFRAYARLRQLLGETGEIVPPTLPPCGAFPDGKEEHDA